MNKEKDIYFPGLNGIRFIAAFAVIISHIENFKTKAGLISLNHTFDFLGTEGVRVFFTLSGFLITYLLLKENEIKDTVSIRKFYLRRVLRIWPLYFLILILGYFVLPFFFYPDYFNLPQESNFLLKFFLSVFFLPNVVLYFWGSYFSTGILWSIGTEEQYYLVWPWLFRKKNIGFISIKYATIIFMSTKIILSIFLFLLPEKHIIEKILYILQHDSMIFGAWGAYLYFYKKNRILDVIYKRTTLLLCFFILILIKLFDIDRIYNPFANMLISIGYIIIILNISTNENSIIKLNNKYIDYLGKISYGLYMYHSIVVAFCIQILKEYLKKDILFSNIILYLLVLFMTIIIAHLSFNFFEKPFLKRKIQYEVVKKSI